MIAYPDGLSSFLVILPIIAQLGCLPL